jgi:diguanylate cyclase (GGDEF)-like protein
MKRPGTLLALSRVAGEYEMPPVSILIVEDNAITRKFMRTALSREGYRVMEADRGEEAVRIFEHDKPQLVLTDLTLPDLDGFELIEQMRILDPEGEVPILAVSGRLDDGRARQAGFDEYLQKPFEHGRLVRTVHRHLDEGRRSNTTLPASAPVSDRLWRAMPALLSAISELAARPRGLERALDEILGVFLDASGFTTGAAFLESATGSLVLRAQLGYSDGARDQLADFYGQLDWLTASLTKGVPSTHTAAGATENGRAVLAAAGVGSMFVIPLIFLDQRLGVLVLNSPNDNLDDAGLDMVRGAAGAVAQGIVLARTISEVSKSEQRFRAICEAAVDGIVVADAEGTVVYMNAVATALFGASVDRGCRRAASLLPFFDREAGQAQEGDLLIPGRGLLPVQVSHRDLHDANLDARTVYIVRDLSDKRKIAELDQLATRDSLTGLFNRRRFEQELDAQLARAARHGIPGVLALIDLDKFKEVNDTFGHAAGDVLLRAAADALRSLSSPSDVAARLGGDEFAVLVPHADPSSALAYAEEIHDRLARQAVAFEGTMITIEASVGIAAFPLHGTSADALLAAADTALYQAKRSGRNRGCVASSDSHSYKHLLESEKIRLWDTLKEKGSDPSPSGSRPSQRPTARPESGTFARETMRAGSPAGTAKAR